MISVVWLEKANELCGFRMSGHAECGEYGEDLVCAAVSALAQTCILGLTEVLCIKPDYRLNVDGESRCILPRELNTEQASGARVLLQTLRVGLYSISMSYPGTLKFTFQEE